MTVMNGAYINGLDTPATNAATVLAAAGTATTDYILFSLTVQETTKGNIYYGLGGDLLASGGTVQSNAAVLLAPVVVAGTTLGKCQRVWLSIGGADSNTFTNITTILTNGGTAATNLINNLVALATSLQALSSKIVSVGFDMDNEDAPISAVVPLITKLYQAGLKLTTPVTFPFTFCPFGDQADWNDALAGVYSSLKVQPVVGYNLQTYSGGTGQDPATWASTLTTYITKHPNTTGLTTGDGFILPIVSCDDTAQPTSTPSQITTNLQGWSSTGASFWATAALLQSTQKYTWAQYAAAIASGITPPST